MYLSFSAIREALEHPDIRIHEHFNARFSKLDYLNPSQELKNDILYLCTITEFSLHNHRIENQSFVIIDDLGLHDKINISTDVNSIILTNKQTQFTHLQTLNGLFAKISTAFIELQQILLEEQETDAFWHRAMELLRTGLTVEQNGLVLFPKQQKERPAAALIQSEVKITVADIEFGILIHSKEELSLLQKEILVSLEPLFFQILKRYTASFEPMEKKMSKIILNLLQSQTPVIRPLEDTVWEDRNEFQMYLVDLPEKQEELTKALSDIDPVSVLSIPVQDTLLILYAVDPLNESTKAIEDRLVKDKRIGSCSYRFTQIEELQNVWKALHLHLQILRRKETPGLFPIGDAVIEVFTEDYRSYASVYPFIHDMIWAMLASDDKESSDLLDTLYIYLLNERSYLKTSKEMDLHRNSIVYRINKITGRYDVDLEDPAIRQNLLLSYRLLNLHA